MSTNPPPVATPAKKKSSASTLLILLVAIVVGYGAINWYINDQKEKKQRETDAMYANLSAQIEAGKAARIEAAMLSGNVVGGMTKYQVQKTWGRPSNTVKVSSLQDESRRDGLAKLRVFEIWEYADTGRRVFIDLDDTVVFVNEPK